VRKVIGVVKDWWPADRYIPCFEPEKVEVCKCSVCGEKAKEIIGSNTLCDWHWILLCEELPFVRDLPFDMSRGYVL